MSRGLGPNGLGRYSAALVDVTLLATLIGCGLPGAIALYAGQGQGSPRWLRKLLPIAASPLPVFAGVALVALWLSRGGLAVGARAGLLLALIGLLTFFQYVREIHSSLLWGAQAFTAQNRINVAVAAVTALGLAALYLQRGLSAESALVVQLVTSLLWSLAAAVWLLGRLRRPEASDDASGEAPPAELRTQVFRVGVRNLLHILPDLLLLRIDVYLIKELLPLATRDAQLGLYQAGVRVAELVLMVPGVLNTVLFAKAAAREPVERVTLDGAKLSLFLALLALGGMALTGRTLLGWFYGPGFSGSFLPCLYVMAGCAAMCVSGPLAGTLAGDAGYPRSLILAQGLGLVVNVAANLYLLPRYAEVGAALASALSYTVSAAIITIAFCRRFGIPAKELFRPESPLSLLRRLR